MSEQTELLTSIMKQIGTLQDSVIQHAQLILEIREEMNADKLDRINAGEGDE